MPVDEFADTVTSAVVRQVTIVHIQASLAVQPRQNGPVTIRRRSAGRF
jgi:hypothetical protein